MDIASLGFKIDTSDVAKAERDLDSLAATGSKSEAAAKGAGNAWTEAGRKIGSGAGAAKQVAPAFNEGAKAIQAQQQALGKLLGQINPVIAALDRLDEQEKQLSGFKASGLLDTETFTEYQGRIAQARNGLTQFESSVKKTGVSSAQTTAALRQLPAQFTDIFTSLASGQAPLTVLLQQGGQIKDSFGGVGPALRETAKYAAALVNPYTVAAAAAVALAVAWKQGSDEAVAYNKALILTGNSAGTNADQMEIMARAIDGVTGTQRQAAAALVEVANAGKFTADQLQGIATAAVAMEEATGKAVSDTVAEFKKLADEPAAASAKLNEQYNYLTAAVYEQIAALEAQGDAAGAAQLAIEAFGDAMQKRSQEIEGNLGLIERAWKGIKDGAAEAWDEMLGVGRPATLEDQLAKLNQRGIDSQSVFSSGLVLGPLGAIKQLYDQITPQIEGATQEGAAQLDQKRTELELLIQQRDQESAWQAELAKTNQSSISAQEELNKKLVASRTNAEKLKDEYAKIDKLVKDAAAGGVNYTDAQVAQLRAAAEKQYGEKTKKPARTPEYRDDAATRLLMSLREQEASLSAQLATEANLTTEQKKRAEFEQQIADLKTKDVLTADQQSLLANQDAIRAQLDRNAAVEGELRLRNETTKAMQDFKGLQFEVLSQEEKSLEVARRRFEVLGKARARGAVNEDDFQSTAHDIGRAAMKDAPAFAGLDPSVGGIAGELEKLTGAEKDLQSWYDKQLEMLATFREERADLNEVWDEQEATIKQQHEDRLAVIERARQQSSLTIAAQVFDNMAALTESKNRELVRIGKAAATAQAIVSGAQAFMNALAVPPYPVGVALAATSAVATAAQIATINGVGFREGGYTGNGGVNDPAGIVHGQEFVFDAESVRRLGRGNLEALQAGRDIASSSVSGRMAGEEGASQTRGGVTVNQTINTTGRVDRRTSNQMANDSARKTRQAQARLG